MITTPLDSAVLNSKEQYIFYHKMVDFALKEIIVSMQQEKLCTQQELIFFKQYSDLLLYSIEAMRIKYMYDEEDHMKVDLTDSGFPNYLEFCFLYNDLELRKQHLDKLADTPTLDSSFSIQASLVADQKKAKSKGDQRENTNYGNSSAIAPKGGWIAFQKYVDDNDITTAQDVIVKTSGVNSKNKIFIISQIDS
jgi:hypothetical protein